MPRILWESLFIPYKDIFIEMLNLINRPESYNIDKHGHLLLCAFKESFNKILVSAQRESKLPHKYLQDTAGIKEISIGAEKLLKSTLSHIELQKIDERVKDLKKIYSDLESLQADLDVFMEKYNTARTHQGKRCKGRTPMETFIEGKKVFNGMNLDKNLAA